jgi:hypothetical protein
MVIPPGLSCQSLICGNRIFCRKVEVGIKLGEAIYCASLYLTYAEYNIQEQNSQLFRKSARG